MPDLMDSPMKSSAIDVLGLGAIAVDDLLYVDHYPAAESKIRVRRRERQCGGQTGTALVAAARFGANCAYAGLLGDDSLSREVVANFAKEGIHTDWAALASDARPAHSTIIVDETALTRTVFAFVEGQLGPAPNSPAASLLRASGVLLIDHHGIAGSLRAAKIARETNRPIVADFERPGEPPFDELLEMVDHLIVSAQFARRVTGVSDLPRAVAAFAGPQRRLVAVTCGAEGYHYWLSGNSDEVVHCPAFQVEVADTTGCGDVFHGVYAAALSQKTPPEECLRKASAAAALKAAQRGGQAGIPSREAIERFLSRQS